MNEEINRAESRGEHGIEDVKGKLRDAEYKNEELKKKYRKLEAQYEAIAGIVQNSMLGGGFPANLEVGVGAGAGRTKHGHVQKEKVRN